MRETEATLGAAATRLVRIGGLAEAVARLAGVPAKRAMGSSGFLAACRTVADSGPPPDSDPSWRPTLVAVRDGRRCVGHAVADDRTARAIAAAAASGERLPVVVRGPLVASLAAREGLRAQARPRRYHADPAVDARLREDLHLFVSAWRHRFVPGGGGRPWEWAIVTPYPSHDPDGGPVRAHVLAWSGPLAKALAWTCGYPAVEDDGMPGFVDAAIRDGKAALTRPPSRGTMETMAQASGFDAADFADGPRVDESDDDLADVASSGSARRGRPRYAPLVFVAAGRLRAFEARAVSCAGRALPRAVHDHAMIRGGRRFADAEGVADFLAATEGWSDEDHRRARQFLRVLPWARLVRDETAWRAVRDGAPMAAAVALALGLEAPPHRKAVAALRGAFWRDSRGGPDRLVPIRRTALAVSGLFARDAHRLPLRPSEVASVHLEARVVVDGLSREAGRAVADRWLPDVAAMAVAAREKEAAVRDLVDVVRWVAEASFEAMGGRPQALGRTTFPGYVACVHVAMESVYGEGSVKRRRRLRDQWHRAQRATMAEAVAFLGDALASYGKRPVAEGDYPHFLPRPTTAGGVTLSPLRDAASLRAEGSLMSHCVGGYAPQCRSGDSMVVSLSAPDGSRSTAEVSVFEEVGHRKRRGRYVVVQHRGPGNGPPPAGHPEALALALRREPSDGWGTLLDRVAEARRASPTGHDPVSLLVPEDADAYAAMRFRHVRPFLPRSDAGLSHEAWLAKRRPVSDLEAEAA